MKKKSKLLCYLVTIIMVAALIPATAFAADGDPEARIGSKQYATLQKAVNAAGPGQTIEVLREIDLDSTPVDIDREDADFRIDLKGKTISADESSCIRIINVDNVEISNGNIICNQQESNCIDIAPYGMSDLNIGTVMIKDINAKNTEAPFGEAIAVGQGDVVIDGGVYEGYCWAINVRSAGKVFLNSGEFKIEDTDSSAVYTDAFGFIDLVTGSVATPSNWKNASSFTVDYNVAKIGDRQYATLQRAINAVGDGQTIDLQKDINISGVTVERADTSFILNLKSNTITSTATGISVLNVENLKIRNGSLICDGADAQAVYVNAEKAVVTLEDVNATNKKVNDESRAVSIENGEVIIDVGIYEGSYYALNVFGSGKADIKCGIFKATGTDPECKAVKIDNDTAAKTINELSTTDPTDWEAAKSFTAQYLPVAGIGITGASKIVAGSTAQMKPTFTPENAKVKTVAWKSSSKAIATIDAAGKVKGVKPGKVTITVTAADRNTVKKTKTVYVVPKKAAMSKVTAKTAGFTAYASKQTGISGYEFQYKKGTKGTLKTVRTTSYYKSISKLTRKATYYVKVRTYKTIDGKRYYGAWSAFKSVKTK